MAAGAAGADASGFVAWALLVRDDGGLDPLYDEHGALYRVHADTCPTALLGLKKRLTSRFGAEASDTADETVR